MLPCCGETRLYIYLLYSSYVLWIHLFFLGSTAPSGPWPPHYRGFLITLRYTTLGNTHLDEWSTPWQRPLNDNTQHSQQRDIHAAGRIWTHNPSKRAALDPSLRLRGLILYLDCIIFSALVSEFCYFVSSCASCHIILISSLRSP